MERSSIFNSLLDLYADESLCSKKIRASFKDEMGTDVGGVTRDVFSCFWGEAYSSMFDGEVFKVPFVPTSKIAEAQAIFCKLGRIFSHGYLLTGKIPIRIAQASLLSMLFGMEHVSDEVLLDSFLSYVTPWEKKMLECRIKGNQLPPNQQDEMLGLFIRMGMRTVPSTTMEGFVKQVNDMARSELLFKPAMALEWMKRGIPSSHFDKVMSFFIGKGAFLKS